MSSAFAKRAGAIPGFQQAEAPSESVTSTRDRNRERKRLQRERQRPVDAIVYEAEDWQLFLSEDTLPQKAGCYPHQLAALVLKELVDNALDADAGATLQYEAGCWIVSDDGPGIDPNRVADLFAVNRALKSSKRDKRLPTRGMLGNGLRVVMAWARRLIVQTRGVRLTLEVDEATGHTIVVQREDVVRVPGLTVRLPAQQRRDADLAVLTLDLARFGPVYDGPSSPWWYGPTDFARFLRSAPADATAADVIRDLGLVPPRTIGTRLARTVIGDEALSLLKVMQGRTKPVPAAKVGRLGPDVYKGCAGYAIKTGILIERAGGHVPYAVEAHVRCQHPAHKGRGDANCSLTINRSASVAQLEGDSYPDFLSIKGCGLEELVAVAPTGDYEIHLSVITPHISLASDGKSPWLEGHKDAIEEVVGKAARQAHRAMESPARPASHRSVVLAHLQEAIAETSEDGKYIFSQRNLFYRVRPFVEQETGQALGWSNFTSILTDYEAEHGDIANLIRDDRGSFHDLSGSIGLGTTAVANYQRPGWQFHKLLFCEKEDHVRILQQAGWPERHDCAVMSSKGYASRAARDLIDAIADTAEHEPVTVFCIHDADAAGTMIAQSLQEATRARGRRRIQIVDIGLQPWEAMAMGLPVEDVSHGKPQPVADYVLHRTGGRHWNAWLQKHRVELNAMTPGQLISWLDDNVEKHGNLKVVPPLEVAIAALHNGIKEAIWQRERDRILRAAEPQIRAAAEAGIAAIRLPNGHSFIADIQREVQERRDVHWTRVVTDAVHAAIAATDAEGAP